MAYIEFNGEVLRVRPESQKRVAEMRRTADAEPMNQMGPPSPNGPPPRPPDSADGGKISGATQIQRSQQNLIVSRRSSCPNPDSFSDLGSCRLPAPRKETLGGGESHGDPPAALSQRPGGGCTRKSAFLCDLGRVGRVGHPTFATRVKNRFRPEDR